MTAAARQARRRDRHRRGKLVLTLEVDELPTVEALIAAGLLDPLRADDKAAVQEAAAELLRLVARHA